MTTTPRDPGVAFHSPDLDAAMDHCDKLCNLLNCIDEGRTSTRSELIGVLELAILAANNLSLRLGNAKRRLAEQVYEREA